MKKWDLLLEWMTHLGTGTWGEFKDAVIELTREDKVNEQQSLFLRLRIILSDLGHVNFFINGTRRWHVLRPALIGLAENEKYLFVGGRNRTIMEQLRCANNSDFQLSVQEDFSGFSQVFIKGPLEHVIQTSKSMGLDFYPYASEMLSSKGHSIKYILESAPRSQEPVNWTVRSWSFYEKKWLNCKLKNTVQEYSNHQNVRRYFVQNKKLGLLELEKRASIYCAAYLKGEKIIKYSREDRILYVPRWAPLPDNFSRLACLSSGKITSSSRESLLFEDISPSVASKILVCLGQGFLLKEAK